MHKVCSRSGDYKPIIINISSNEDSKIILPSLPLASHKFLQGTTFGKVCRLVVSGAFELRKECVSRWKNEWLVLLASSLKLARGMLLCLQSPLSHQTTLSYELLKATLHYQAQTKSHATQSELIYLLRLGAFKMNRCLFHVPCPILPHHTNTREICLYSYILALLVLMF